MSLSGPFFRNAPLFPIALGLLTGIVVDAWTLPPWGVYPVGGILAAVCAALPPIRRACPNALLFATAICTGGLLHWSDERVIPVNGVQQFAVEGGRIARIRGFVDSQPQLRTPQQNAFAAWSFQTEHSTFILRAAAMEMDGAFTEVTGRLHVVVREPVLDLEPGDTVALFGRLYALTPPRNPGAFDWSAQLRRNGIVARFTCRHRESVRPVPDARPPPFVLSRFLQSVRHRLHGFLAGTLAPESELEGGLLRTLVLGQRSQIDRQLNSVFIAAGCAHLLAVSGVHVAILMFIVRWASALVLHRPKPRVWAMLSAVVLYALITEPRPPIMRASIVALAYCAARLTDRDQARFNWISLAIIVLGVIDPPMVFGVGYQLSFAAVLGVLYLAPGLLGLATATWRSAESWIMRAPPLPEDLRQARIDAAPRQPAWIRAVWWLGRRIGVAFAVALAAWLASLPIVANTFYRVHPWGVVGSLVALPMVTVVMIGGFVRMLVGAVNPALGEWLGMPFRAVDQSLIELVGWFSRLPGSTLPMAPMPGWLVLAFYAFLIALMFRFGVRGLATGPPDRPSVARGAGWLTASVYACGAAFLAGAAMRWVPALAVQPLRITALSVGAGSAIVIELPHGSSMLYDAGSLSPFDVGSGIVRPFLGYRGIHRLERVIVSHANVDHFSGLPAILEDVTVGSVLFNRYFAIHARPRTPAARLLGRLTDGDDAMEVAPAAPHSWREDGVEFELLWPETGRESLSPNNASTVLRISYGGHSILLAGDIEEDAQRSLLNHADVTADVLVLPHHGGVCATTRAFIDAVGADVLIRSSGQRNAETRNGLLELAGDTPLFNTADVGAVQTELSASGIKVRGTLHGARWDPTEAEPTGPTVRRDE